MSKRNDGKKVLCLAVLIAFCSIQPVQAKSEKAAEPSSNAKMPEASSNASLAPGYDAAKKAIEESEKEAKGPSVKDKVEAVVQAVVAAVEEKAEPQKGDPKTDLSKSENSEHSKAKSDTLSIAIHRVVDLSGWKYSSSTYTDNNTITAYYYDPSSKNPFNMVKVVYNSTTLAMLSATGYKTGTGGITAPDLTGMNLTLTATHSDGSLAFQSYESVPTSSGTVRQFGIYYDSVGTFSYYTDTIIQPLDLKKIRL